MRNATKVWVYAAIGAILGLATGAVAASQLGIGSSAWCYLVIPVLAFGGELLGMQVGFWRADKHPERWLD